MTRNRLLESPAAFRKEFERCCHEYESLDLAVAWCGDPSHKFPFRLLRPLGDKVRALVGISFHHTHPDAIQWFMDNDADIRIVEESNLLFHPKFYLFRKKRSYALIVGSSNFTYGGFCKNLEANFISEGKQPRSIADHTDAIAALFDTFRNDTVSFEPSRSWLEMYRRKYLAVRKKTKSTKLPTQHEFDDDVPTAGWIEFADWDLYLEQVDLKLVPHNGGKQHHKILKLVARRMPLPWTTSYFADIENRRLIGGMKPYGWFGHVAAAGMFRSLLANGNRAQHEAIVQSVNALAVLEPPLDTDQLSQHLSTLVGLGHTIRVWSRVLCIVRPDIYCTIASDSVRRNLSKTLAVSQRSLQTVEGYTKLLSMIHSSPWFNSPKPDDRWESKIWKRRAAFMDAIFYETNK